MTSRGSSVFAGYQFRRSAGSLSSVSGHFVVPPLDCSHSRRIRDNYLIDFGIDLGTGPSGKPRGAGAEVEERCRWTASGRRWSYQYTAYVSASANEFPNQRTLAVRTGQQLAFVARYTGGRATAQLSDLTSGRIIQVSASGVARLPYGNAGASATPSVLIERGVWSCGPTRSPTGSVCPIPPFGTAHFSDVRVDGHALSRAPGLEETFLAYQSRRRVNVSTTRLRDHGTAFGSIFRHS